MNNKEKDNPIHDPLYQLGRNAVRQCNAAMLPTLLIKLEKKLAAAKLSNFMEAELRILTAEIARSLGKETCADEILKIVTDNLPEIGTNILSRAQRLRALILLDCGATSAARDMAEIIDATIIENSEARGVAMVSRPDKDITVDTLLLMNEIALYEGDYDRAGELLIKAGTRLAEMEGPDNAKRVSAFEAQQKTIYCAELRYKLHLWRAVLRIVSGDEQGFNLLRDLADSMYDDKKADRRLLARVRALLGDFDTESSSKDAPVGISRNEAMRLFALVSQPVIKTIRTSQDEDDNFLELDVPSLKSATDAAKMPGGIHQLQEANALAASGIGIQTTTALVERNPSLNEKMPLSPNLDKFLENQSKRDEEMAKMFEKMTQVITSLPVQSAEQQVKTQSKRPFAFGGGFAFFDLVTQLGNAEMMKFTGYFQVQWSPEMVESSIKAGNLDPRAREGEGFVFVKDGFIIDATIKNYDPPAAFQMGMPGASEDAKNSLTILIQIGLAQKLDCLPDGFGSFYDSQAVKERGKRLDYNQWGLATLIAERDEELQ